MNNSKLVLEKNKMTLPWQVFDPFIFTMHHVNTLPKANEDMTPNSTLEGREIGADFSNKDGWNMYHGKKYPGFPAHPHKGFETVTIVDEGFVDHTDSLGSAGRFGKWGRSVDDRREEAFNTLR